MLNFSQSQLKEIKVYCKLNDISDTDAFIKACFEKGYNIEKYGLLSEDGRLIEKEVIVEKRVEVPVEVIKEVEKVVEVVKEVPVEKVVIKEVIQEIPVDRVVEKEVYITDDKQVDELLLKIQQLENEMSKSDLELNELRQEFSTKTQELEDVRQEFSTKTEEMENIFQNKMSKKDEELDKLRHSLDEVLAKPPVDTTKEKALQETLQKLKTQIIEKDKKIKELENELMNFLNSNEKKGIFLRGSNLGDTLYK
jgi:chromosome segregation ATPase